MNIKWPDIPLDQCEKPEELIRAGDRFTEAVTVERGGGETKIIIDMKAEAVIPDSVLAADPTDAVGISELIIRQLLLDLNVSLMPLIVYRLREAGIK